MIEHAIRLPDQGRSQFLADAYEKIRAQVKSGIVRRRACAVQPATAKNMVALRGAEMQLAIDEQSLRTLTKLCRREGLLLKPETATALYR